MKEQQILQNNQTNHQIKMKQRRKAFNRRKKNRKFCKDKMGKQNTAWPMYLKFG